MPTGPGSWSTLRQSVLITGRGWRGGWVFGPGMGEMESLRYQEIAESCSKELGVEVLAKSSQELELMDRLVMGELEMGSGPHHVKQGSESS